MEACDRDGVLERYIQKPSESEYAAMRVGSRIAMTEDAGDILEAIGGICHAWAPESRAFVREKLVAWSCALNNIDALRADLNMCVRRVKEIVAYYYRTGGHDKCVSLSIAAIDCEGMRMEQDSRPPLQRRDGLQKESPQSRKQDMGSGEPRQEDFVSPQKHKTKIVSGREYEYGADVAGQGLNKRLSSSSWDESWRPSRRNAEYEKWQGNSHEASAQAYTEATGSAQERTRDTGSAQEWKEEMASPQKQGKDVNLPRKHEHESWRQSKQDAEYERWQGGSDAASAQAYKEATGSAQGRTRSTGSAQEWMEEKASSRKEEKDVSLPREHEHGVGDARGCLKRDWSASSRGEGCRQSSRDGEEKRWEGCCNSWQGEVKLRTLDRWRGRWDACEQPSEKDWRSDASSAKYDTRRPAHLPPGDKRFAPQRKHGRVYVCDNKECRSKHEHGSGSLPFDGQFVQLLEVRGYALDVLGRMYEARQVDVTWLCSRCHRRPGERDLDVTRARIEAFDTGRIQRAMGLMKQGFRPDRKR